MNAKQDFDDLAREIMAFRWAIDRDDQARREPALAHFLAIELSPTALDRLAIHVQSLRSFWERTRSGDWDGWSDEEDASLAKTDALGGCETLTKVELDDFNSRHRGITWQIGMWKVYQDHPNIKRSDA